RSRIFVARNVALKQKISFTKLTTHDEVVDWISVAASRRIISCVASDPKHVWEVGLVKNGAVENITKVNSHVDSWQIPQFTVQLWTNKGTSVEGVLEVPHGYDLGSRHPMPLIVKL